MGSSKHPTCIANVPIKRRHDYPHRHQNPWPKRQSLVPNSECKTRKPKQPPPRRVFHSKRLGCKLELKDGFWRSPTGERYRRRGRRFQLWPEDLASKEDDRSGSSADSDVQAVRTVFQLECAEANNIRLRRAKAANQDELSGVIDKMASTVPCPEVQQAVVRAKEMLAASLV
ncbi:hypothetical protein N7G274_010054 [Stereocaulon virgatum]|uniref:Uncharacterized protein n=1 Tax=Stereocaulon virgatum TaxID=373712 RepID=A0ABR3ZWY1_9LECA